MRLSKAPRNMTAAIFQSSTAFATAFAEGLRQLLDDDGLGAYILVLANANFDAALYQALREDLHAGFERHLAALRAAQAQGTALPPDDVAVFEQLPAIGLAHPVRWRRVGPWELQFNPLRALRPARAAKMIIDRLYEPFDPAAFHFNKPFLRKEAIWSGELLGKNVELLYNKFSFVSYHGLLVPERERELPQWLSAETHAYIWKVCKTLPLSGIGFGYNAYGAYASVNHLHFQMLLRSEPLPLESPRWRHNGGTEAYPAACEVFDDAVQAYAFIEHLHAADTAYNLLYRPGKLYCLPRAIQNAAAPRMSDWHSGIAWYEMCGGAVLVNADAFAAVTETDVARELEKLR